MKKGLKALLLVMCAITLVVATVFTTLAYLKTETVEVKNTFTVGNLQITLDEAPVDANGKKTTGDRGIENNYKLIPGNVYDKDPTIHLQPNSEACWLYAEVNNGISAIEADTTIDAQIKAKGWTVLETSGSKTIYYKAAEAVPGTAEKAVDYVIFENFTLKGDADVNAYGDATITIKGYAVQKDGFEGSAQDAWNATFGDQA